MPFPRPLAAILSTLLAQAATNAAATEQLSLAGGFLPDPRAVSVTVTGASPAADWVRGCPGQVPASPGVVVTFTSPDEPLRVLQSGAGLAAVVVAGPDGVHHCAAADTEGLASLRIEPARAGTYVIWPAATASGVPVEARVLLSERLEPASAIVERDATPTAPLAIDNTAAFGTLTPGGTLEVLLSGEAEAAAHGPGCVGDIDPRRPDATLTLREAAPRLAFDAESRRDTTLLVATPDGRVLCDDDTEGLDPRVVVAPAPAGNYAIWVGNWDAAFGDPATLSATLGGVDPAPDPFAGGDPFADSPFLGRDIPTASAALDILLEDPEAAANIAFARREPLGADGFLLHDVTLGDGRDGVPPLRMGRLRVTDLDLAGLSEAGAPGTFRVVASGIDYDAVSRAVEEEGGFGLPGIGETAQFSVDVSLLPPLGDASRRDLAATLTLEDQLGLGLSTRLMWPDAPGLPAALERLPAEGLTLEVTNLGYVGLALRGFGAAMGLGPSEAGEMLLGGLSVALAPITPGGPKARLLDVLREVKSAPDGPGVMRVILTTDAPRPVEDLMTALERADRAGAMPDGIALDFAYDPMP